MTDLNFALHKKTAHYELFFLLNRLYAMYIVKKCYEGIGYNYDDCDGKLG